MTTIVTYKEIAGSVHMAVEVDGKPLANVNCRSEDLEQIKACFAPETKFVERVSRGPN